MKRYDYIRYSESIEDAKRKLDALVESGSIESYTFGSTPDETGWDVNIVPKMMVSEIIDITAVGDTVRQFKRV